MKYAQKWKRMVDGNDRALEDLYLSFFDKLYYFGFNFTQDEQIIKDCIQLLFIEITCYRKKLTEVKYVNAYIFKSFKRLLVKELKKNERFEPLEELGNPYFETTASAEKEVILQEASEELKKAISASIQKLTPKQREAIYLKFTCSLSYLEMSEYLGIGIESARVLIARSIQKIRLEIQKNTDLDTNNLILFYLSTFKGWQKN